MINTSKFWSAVLEQDAQAIRSFFSSDAYVNWHNTNEHFTVEEFIQANCQYPGAWAGEIERELHIGNTVITVTHVYNEDGTASHHVTSFLNIKDDRIISLDEYWGEDGEAPDWRKALQIGKRIK